MPRSPSRSVEGRIARGVRRARTRARRRATCARVRAAEHDRAPRLMGRHIVLLPGDGIGPEITDPTVELLDAVAPGELEYERHVFGGASIDADGVALTDDTLEACRRADAVLLA